MKFCMRFFKAVAVLASTFAAIQLAHAANLDSMKDIKWTFYGDGYFTYNFNNPTSGIDSDTDTRQNGYYNYNRAANSLELNDIGFTLQKDFHDLAAFVQVDFGPQADYQNGLNHGRNISQAYLSFTPSELNGWRIDGGKFISHMSFESQYAGQNWNYSRSLATTYGLPIYNVGARIIAPQSLGKIRPNFYVVNGSDGTTLENSNKQLTLGARLDFDVNSALTLQYNVMAGPQQRHENGNTRVVNEVNGKYKLSNRTDLAAAAIYGNESDAVNPQAGTTVDATGHWQGLAVYGRYAYNDKWAFSPRIEIYQDKDSPNTLASSITEDNESVTSITVTASDRLSSSLEARFEARYDKSDFSDAFRKGTTDTTDNQTTLTAAILWGI